MGQGVVKAAAALIGRGVTRSARNARTAAAVGAGANVASRTARAESELRTIRGSEVIPSRIAKRGLESLKNARTNPNIADITGSERRIVKTTSARLDKELIRQRDTITRARNLIGRSAVERALDLKNQNLSRGQKAAQTRRDRIVNEYRAEAARVNMAAQREKRRGG